MFESIKYYGRFSSLDIMRGIAILLMIEAHIRIGSYLIGTNSFGLKYFCALSAAPFFLIVAGIGYQLFLKSRIKRYEQNKLVFMEAFWRAFILVVISTVIFLIGSTIFPIFEYDGVIKWNIFQVIGVGYIFGFFIRNSIKKKVISIILLFVLSIAINNYQIEILYPLSTGLLPLIPYISYFILGQLLYEFYKQENVSLNRNRNLISISFIFLLFNILIYFSFPYEPIPHHIYLQEYLMISSIYILINLVIIRWIDIKNKFTKFFIPLKNIGKISFTAYYLQMLLVVFPFYGIFKTIPTIANLTLLIISILALSIIERKWRKYNYIFGLEWILRNSSLLLMEKTLKWTN